MNPATTIGFIGAGNMATALIRGLLADGSPAASIGVSDPDASKTSTLAGDCGVTVFASNAALVSACDIVVLAVKPQIMEAVVAPLAEALHSTSCVLLSVAAGITLDRFGSWTSAAQPVVRCMPNTPALVGIGASALYASPTCSPQQKQQCEDILAAVGEVVWLQDEEQMNAVTALSGSGPAYIFLLIEAMQAAGESLGLPAAMASSLALQTALGAATLAKQSDVDAAELRRRVTSPGGTTAAALTQFESEDFRGLVKRALEQAARRSRELAG